MKTTAIILAGGRGKRMNSAVPKQYLKVNGREILYYTLEAFMKSDVDDVIIVCSMEDEELVRGIAGACSHRKPFSIAYGGKERYNSVYNGLLACQGTAKVLVHDGARCLVSTELINKMIAKLDEVDACIAAVPVKDTIKKVDASGRVLATPLRSELVAVQTPQGFAYDKLLGANEEMFKRINAGADEKAMGITDDAMIIENFSDTEVYVIEGEETNIKVTTPQDLMSVKLYLDEIK